MVGRRLDSNIRSQYLHFVPSKLECFICHLVIVIDNLYRDLSNTPINNYLSVEIWRLSSSTITLKNCGVNGAIPTVDRVYNKLKILDLQDNIISGTIPSSMTNQTVLQHLALRRNQLSGSIPPAILTMVNLLHLELDSNQLSGPIPPFGDMKYLLTLNLNNNQLNGSIPRAWALASKA